MPLKFCLFDGKFKNCVCEFLPLIFVPIMNYYTSTTLVLNRKTKPYRSRMSAPLTDEEKRRQISVRGVASLEGVDDLKSGESLY